MKTANTTLYIKETKSCTNSVFSKMQNMFCSITTSYVHSQRNISKFLKVRNPQALFRRFERLFRVKIIRLLTKRKFQIFEDSYS